MLLLDRFINEFRNQLNLLQKQYLVFSTIFVVYSYNIL